MSPRQTRYLVLQFITLTVQTDLVQQVTDPPRRPELGDKARACIFLGELGFINETALTTVDLEES